MKSNFLKTMLGVILPAFSLQMHAQDAAIADHLVFNEVMQSNIDYLMVNNDFPDSWVELYNPTNSPVDITGYSIGEHADMKNAYTFPSGRNVVPAKGHLIIYCDKEAYDLHASFRIDSGKATLFLFDKSGNIVDQLSLAKMPAPNVAYGRVTDGSEAWQYEVTPTAGQPNGGQGSAMILPEPVFSNIGGLCNDVFDLTISIPEGVPEDTKLYMTIDGSEPDPNSSTSSLVPDGTATLTVDQTKVVRAKLFSAEAASPRSTTHSYIYHPRETKLPVVSIVTNDDYMYGPEIGILSSVVNGGKPNYMQKWRRPLNIEYFNTEDGSTEVFNQLGETAVSGVSTREQPQKSMKIYANKRFGTKNYKGNFWTDKPDVKKVKSFVLRSGGNNSFTTRINDAAVQRLFGTHIGEELDWQAYQPVIVYINGIYRGEFGMRERADTDYVEANWGIEDVEEADETSYQEPEAGSLFADFYASYHDQSTTYEQLAEQMDMDNFTQALIAEMYAMNTDFPTNNVAMWRSTEEGGKWRWILKDLDRAGMNLTLYPRSFDMFNYLFNPDLLLQYSGMHHFDIYMRMISFAEFRERFIDLFATQLGDFLKPELVSQLLDTMSSEIAGELKPTFYAYNCYTEWSSYNQNMKLLKKFFNERQTNLYSQMASFFNLGEVVAMQVEDKDSCNLTINDVALTEGNFNGSYFTNRQLRLDSGDEQHTWKMTVTSRYGEQKETSFDSSKVNIMLTDYVGSSSDTVLLQTVGTAPQPEPVVTIDDITSLIQNYLTEGSTVTIDDITALIQKYLEQTNE